MRTDDPKPRPCGKCGAEKYLWTGPQGNSKWFCRPCGRARTRKAYHADVQSGRAKAQAAYHAQTPEQLAAMKVRQKAWREANHEHHLESMRRWREANRDRVEAYNAAYYVANRAREIARCLAYIKAHPEVDAASKGRRNALKRETVCEHGLGCVTSTFLALVRKSMCLYCDASAAHADHFIPLARGGLHCRENIVPSCQSCNCSKNARDPWAWLARIAS